MSAAVNILPPVLMAAHKAAEADSMALDRLTNMVKLTAFACEARRTLEGIGNALTHHEKAKDAIGQSVDAWRNWTVLQDVTGEVLQDVAAQLSELSEAISRRPFELQDLEGAGHE